MEEGEEIPTAEKMGVQVNDRMRQGTMMVPIVGGEWPLAVPDALSRPGARSIRGRGPPVFRALHVWPMPNYGPGLDPDGARQIVFDLKGQPFSGGAPFERATEFFKTRIENPSELAYFKPANRKTGTTAGAGGDPDHMFRYADLHDCGELKEGSARMLLVGGDWRRPWQALIPGYDAMEMAVRADVPPSGLKLAISHDPARLACWPRDRPFLMQCR